MKKKKGRYLTAEQTAEFNRLAFAGVKPPALAKHFHLTGPAVYHRLARLGLTRKSSTLDRRMALLVKEIAKMVGASIVRDHPQIIWNAIQTCMPFVARASGAEQVCFADALFDAIQRRFPRAPEEGTACKWLN